MTIASEITDLQTNLANAKSAVTAKGGTVGNTGLAGLASEINTIPSGGGGGKTPKDVNFYDLDGTLVESWTVQELASKTALPANPTPPTGLTALGWNWTLEDLKTENAPMTVGQVYRPTDEKTHLFVEVDANHLTPHCSIGLNGTATIDWGDGTTTTLTGTSLDTDVGSYHTYAQAGSYEVTIELGEGSVGRIRGSRSYVSFLWKGEQTQSSLTRTNLDYGQQVKKLFIGKNFDFGVVNYGLNYLGIETVTFPYTPTNYNQYWVSFCPNLNCAIIIPPNLGDTLGSYFLSGCSSFNNQISIPKNIENTEQNFMSGCYSFSQTLVFSSSFSRFNSTNQLYNCDSLKKIIVNTSAYPSANQTLATQNLASSA